MEEHLWWTYFWQKIDSLSEDRNNSINSLSLWCRQRLFRVFEILQGINNVITFFTGQKKNQPPSLHFEIKTVTAQSLIWDSLKMSLPRHTPIFSYKTKSQRIHLPTPLPRPGVKIVHMPADCTVNHIWE